MSPRARSVQSNSSVRWALESTQDALWGTSEMPKAKILEPTIHEVFLSDHRLISTPHPSVVAPGQARNLVEDLRKSDGSEVVRGFIELAGGAVLNDGLTAQVFSPCGIHAAELTMGPGVLQPGVEPTLELVQRIAHAPSLQRATSLITSHQYNYFHFVAQTLPTLAQMSNQISGSVPVILGGWHSGGSKFGEELMKLLFPGVNAVFLKVGGTLRIDELYGIPPLTTNVFEPSGIELVRERGRSAVTTSGAASDSRVVYLARGDNERNRRRLINEAEVIGLLERKWPHVQVIVPGRISVAQQIQAVANAQVIVGLHGSQLTNMIWAPRSATVVELVPDDMDTADLFAALGRVLGLNYLESRSTGVQGAHWSSSDQTAVLADLDTTIHGL